MQEIKKKKALTIYRLDEAKNKNKYTNFIYGQKGGDFGAHMLLQYDKIKNKWTLHIQDMIIAKPNIQDAKPIIMYKLAGVQRIYELKN